MLNYPILTLQLLLIPCTLRLNKIILQHLFVHHIVVLRQIQDIVNLPQLIHKKILMVSYGYCKHPPLWILDELDCHLVPPQQHPLLLLHIILQPLSVIIPEHLIKIDINICRFLLRWGAIKRHNKQRNMVQLIIYSVEDPDLVAWMQPARNIERPENRIGVLVELGVVDALVEG